jgi:hypothetical protein
LRGDATHDEVRGERGESCATRTLRRHERGVDALESIEDLCFGAAVVAQSNTEPGQRPIARALADIPLPRSASASSLLVRCLQDVAEFAASSFVTE